ncbi:hypothetical protein Tco_0865925 [Tanacetum coccineum]
MVPSAVNSKDLLLNADDLDSMWVFLRENYVIMMTPLVQGRNIDVQDPALRSLLHLKYLLLHTANDNWKALGITHREDRSENSPAKSVLLNERKPHSCFEAASGLCDPSLRLLIYIGQKAVASSSKADIGFLLSVTPPNRKGYRIFNIARKIMETIHVTFDELTGKMAPVHFSPGPAPIILMPGPISSGLVPNPPPTSPYVPPTNKELDILFQYMFDEYFETSTVDRLVPPALAAQASVNPTGPSVSTPIDQEAPSGSHSPSSSDHQSSNVHHGVAAEHSIEINPLCSS